MQAEKIIQYEKPPPGCFIHTVSDYDTVASISLIIKWKNNNRKSIVVDHVFLSWISFIAVEFTTFWFIFLSVYLFSKLFDHKDIYRIFVFHGRGLILRINGRKKVMGRKITLSIRELNHQYCCLWLTGLRLVWRMIHK